MMPGLSHATKSQAASRDLRRDVKRARSLCRRPAPPAPGNIDQGARPSVNDTAAAPINRNTGKAIDRPRGPQVQCRRGRRQPDLRRGVQVPDAGTSASPRLLIGRITGLAVQSLTVSPQETAVRRTPEDPEHDLPLTLLRMDFAARVQTRDGSVRQVLIEIQKANAPTVIERFRRYLGQQIGSGDNILTHPSGRTEAVPIVTIYFLGYALDDLSDEAVIDVCPRVTERRTGRDLAASHPLVEGIHHRSHIIQIPRLASRRRDELERLLAIFDQGLVKDNGRGDAHVLTIEEGEYPVECAFVLRQLREAMAEEEVRRTMEGEDLLLRDSMLLARQVEHHERRAEQERQRAQRAERAQQQAEQAQQQAEQAQQQAEQAQQQAEQERRLLLTQAIRRLHGLGQDAEAIAAALAVDADEVRRVLSG